MAEQISYPSIDPTFFDLIIVGTGLPEAVIAAAASAAGKSVLHLDANSFYGGHFSSLPVDEFAAFLEKQRDIPESATNVTCSEDTDGDYLVVDLKTRPLYSDIEISSHVSKEALEPSRKFSLDLSGPRVLFCADSAVDLMLKSGASHHIEFKSVDACFVYGADVQLSAVPDSRAAIFKDRNLGLIEKNQLMRFFKLVQEHLGSSATNGEENEEDRRISEEDLESPFIEFLEKQRLPPKIKSIILYAIAMADYDQENHEVCKRIIKTKDGIESLAVYHSSVGRFSNAAGAMIYPIYGQGELPQAFCRCAAVKGALYVLRMPVTSLLVDKGSMHYKGIRLASGQDLFSHQLVLDPSFAIHLPSDLSLPILPTESSHVSPLSEEVKGKVARGVCITRSSIKPDTSNLLLVFPPRSLYSEQVTAVRALQLGSNLAVCPSGLFVLYLEALCDDANQGKKLLQSAIDALFSLSASDNSQHGSMVQSGDTVGGAEPIEGEMKLTLLWSAMYIQELTMGSSETIISAPMADGSLDYRDLLGATVQGGKLMGTCGQGRRTKQKLFHKMYPQEQFFPETPDTKNTEDSAD